MTRTIQKTLAACTLVLGLGLVVAACSTPAEPTKDTATRSAAKSAAPASSAPATEHGDAHAKPGSHEDWCGEHAVPESKCTRCNAKLIPAFKATKDWCEEHSVPQSQCTKCDPDLKIVRPPKGG